ncbi:MAG: nucleotidyltransferase domain-containing protein [Lachnospiraceae bacterium]
MENSRFKSDLQSLYQEVGFDRAEIFRERLPEETKELVKELYELQLKFSGIKDVSLYMDKFDILYEQGEMENLIPKGEQNRILENIPFTEWKNPYIDTNVEEADKTEPQKNVVEEFKAKTDELFHEISEMNPSEIEETIKRHVQAKIDESGIAAEIVDVAVVGSRCRGLEGESSDLDVVVELSTNEREDVLFDTLNEGGLHIGGIQVDINPITAQRTGTLETYLPKVEEYLDGVREAREHEQVKEAVHREQTQAEVTLTVAECGEFHNLGEFYENIPMVDEAIAIWKQIPPERMNGIPAIGISIHRPGDEPYQDTEMDILSGRRIDLEILDYIPEIKNNPQAMEVIAQLAAKLPDMEIDGKMSEEMEARVWEIRMPDLTPAEQLAVLFDRFVYDYDRNQYHDSIQSMTENVADGAEAIEKGDTGYMTEWLASVIAEGAEPEETKKAAELLEKLSEYKPLAKIEEVEESNFNMIDNMLNNGAGEKAQKEENRREQERPAARTSLKARLAEKKALVSDQGKDNEAKENEKKKQREM